MESISDSMCPLAPRFCGLCPEVIVWVRPLHFLSLDDNQDRAASVPLLFHQRLIGFTDVELQVMVVAQCDEAFHQSTVLLC